VIIVDANVAIKWIIPQILRDRARDIISRAEVLAVPSMFTAEVTTALWQYARSGHITNDQAHAGLAQILDQITLFVEDTELADEAIALGLDLNYAPYDCFYLVLAMRRSAPFVTADRRLINRLASTKYKSHVVHLADWT
jgi:predicted nucleic acid-binding protein